MLWEIIRSSTLRIKGMKPNKLNTTITHMSTKSNISTASPFFSVISCSVLIYIHLPPPIPSHFQIPKLVEIHKLLVGIWYIPSTALHVPAETSFLFFNCSSVESRGAIPESEKYEKKYKLCTH